MKTKKGKKKFLKYKFYRRYLTDFWGSLTKRKKKKSPLGYINKRLEILVRRKIRKMRRSVRKKMYQKFNLKKRNYNPNRIFNLSKKSKESRKIRIKRLKYRGLLLAMKKKLRVYYGKNLKRRKLRKLSFLVNLKAKRFFSKILEGRIDSLILRSNFADTIAEARQLVRTNKVRILTPRRSNKLTWLILSNPAHRVPSYTPIDLISKFKIKRNKFLYKLLVSKSVSSYTPDYLFVNFNLMHSFTTSKLTDRKVKYIFPARLSYFSGLSKYI